MTNRNLCRTKGRLNTVQESIVSRKHTSEVRIVNIKEATRRLIIDELLMYGCVPGQLSVADFVQRVFPKAMDMPTTDHRFGMTTAIDDIRQHMDNNEDWTFENLFCTYLDLLHVEDEDFIYFLEQYTHPVIRRFNITEDLECIYFKNECADAINKYLVSDGYELIPSETIGDKVVYTVKKINPGVQGVIKNIIFASQYKPEIVLEDALNNDIKIISNRDKCLVYDKPVLRSGISWKELQEWYDDSLLMLDTGKGLKERLRESIDSPPEKLFYETYLEIMEKRNGEIPALLPQVCLYYDPKLEIERIKKIFEHQRMDFLMIISEQQRVVIEIDGVQHYADYVKGNTKHYASVDKYAEMVAANREMTLAGYDVYRFGGKELYDQVKGKNIIKQFFARLFEKYGIKKQTAEG